jgi:hypothetical protein
LRNTLSNLQIAYVEVAREIGSARPPGAPTTPAQEQEQPSKPAEQPSPGTPEPSAPISSTEPETESKKKFTKSYGP